MTLLHCIVYNRIGKTEGFLEMLSGSVAYTDTDALVFSFQCSFTTPSRSSASASWTTPS